MSPSKPAPAEPLAINPEQPGPRRLACSCGCVLCEWHAVRGHPAAAPEADAPVDDAYARKHWRPSPPPAPAEPVAWLIEDDCNGAGSMRRTYFSAEGEALVHASVRVGCRLVKLYAHPPAAPAEAERLRKALEDAKKRIAPLCGEGTGYSERAEDAMAIIDAALGGREEAP